MRHAGTLAAFALYATTVGHLGAGLALLRIAASGDFSVAGPILIGLGLLSIAWATLAGLAQSELHSLLAHSAIGRAGFVALAIGCGPTGRRLSSTC